MLATQTDIRNLCANVIFLKKNVCKSLFLLRIELVSHKIQIKYRINKVKPLFTCP